MLGVIKKETIIGVEPEVTEGTYVAPSGVNSFLQPLEGGFNIAPAKELLSRTILTSSIGLPTPRTGIKSVAGALPVEYRASGTEGEKTDFDQLLESALGASRQIVSQTTTKSSGNTDQILQIEDADIGRFTVGDIIVVLESGDHIVSPITARTTSGGSATITLLRTRAAGVFSDSVVIAKSTIYLSADSGHPSLSLTFFHGNEIDERAIGTKVNSMSVDNFTVGQLASLNFGFEGLSFSRQDGSAPFTPTFDTGVPPILLGACLFENGVQKAGINTFAMSLTNTQSFLTDLCDADGRTGSRFTGREITGSFNPQMDDTTFAEFTRFDDNTEFSIFIFAGTPSAVSGELTLGSVVGIFLPQVIITEAPIGDVDGILIDDLSFSATRGANGTSDDILMGFI